MEVTKGVAEGERAGGGYRERAEEKERYRRGEKGDARERDGDTVRERQMKQRCHH